MCGIDQCWSHNPSQNPHWDRCHNPNQQDFAQTILRNNSNVIFVFSILFLNVNHGIYLFLEKTRNKNEFPSLFQLPKEVYSSDVFKVWRKCGERMLINTENGKALG